MAVFRVHKNKDYTTIDNNIFKNKNLSWKAKGLLCVMLSLPDNWSFSIEGLTMLSGDKISSTRTGIQELEDNGYLKRTRIHDEKGILRNMIYDIYESPMLENRTLVEPICEKPTLENRTLEQPIYILNTNRINKKEIYKEKYGVYGRVRLTKEEYTRLVEEFGEDFIKRQIEKLDEYVESNNNKNKYTNFNLVLRKSIRENWFKEKDVPYWFDKKIEGEEISEEDMKELENFLHGDYE